VRIIDYTLMLSELFPVSFSETADSAHLVLGYH